MRLSERLKEVRQSLKLTLDVVSQQTHLGVSTLSEFENDKREPRIGQLKQLADVYHRPLGYFLDEAVPPPEVVLWRQRPASPVAENVQARLVELAEQYRSLEVLCGQLTECELPYLHSDAAALSYPAVSKLAHKVRKELGLGERPGEVLLRVLEEVCNVKVFHLAFEPSGTAACTISERYGAAILLNSQNVPWRRNFDLAHELFHLLTWRTFRHDATADSAEASVQEEKFATCFARNLLMPSEVFREAVDTLIDSNRKIDADGLFEVAREFAVSAEAVLSQMAFVYSIPEAKIKTYLDQLRGRMVSWDREAQAAPPERPYRFQALARQALRKGLISTGNYAQYVGISRRDAMKVVEEDAEDDVQIEVAHS